SASTASTASRIARVSSAARRLERTEGLVIASQIVDVLAIARQVVGLREPGNGLLEPVAESFKTGDPGRPAEQLLRLGVAGAEPVDLAALRAQPHGILLDLDRRTHQPGDRLCGVADRNLEAASDVDDLTDAGLGSQRGDESVDRIGD